MEIQIIKIGNSKGLRLSKAILEKYGINDKVELVLEENHMVIKPIKEPRKGWRAAFKQMAKRGDDQLAVPDVFEDENLGDEWK
jgi:antitoxin MazE